MVSISCGGSGWLASEYKKVTFLTYSQLPPLASSTIHSRHNPFLRNRYAHFRFTYFFAFQVRALGSVAYRKNRTTRKIAVLCQLGVTRGYKDGLQPESLADGNWLVKQNQPVSKIETKSDTNLRSLYES